MEYILFNFIVASGEKVMTFLQITDLVLQLVKVVNGSVVVRHNFLDIRGCFHAHFHKTIQFGTKIIITVCCGGGGHCG